MVPNFILTMVLSTRYAAGEALFLIKSWVQTRRLHQLATNLESRILKKCNALTPVLAIKAVAHKCPPEEQVISYYGEC